MAYSPNPRCLAIATKAANGKLSEAEILDAFQRIADHKAQLDSAGIPTGRDARLRKFAAEEAERTRIAAAMQRRHTALNIIVRQRLEEQVTSMMDQGMPAYKAMQALNEGAGGKFVGVANGRKSMATQKLAFRAEFVGEGLMARIERERPHLKRIIATDKQLDQDVLREMWELRDGGKPGITKNADAQWLAKTFADAAEHSRTRLNNLGAAIGKLDGWNGVQTHDSIKMLGLGADAKSKWIGRITPLLDPARTFPEGVSAGEAAQILGDIFDTIITGLPNRISPAEKGQRVNPANMAKSLGKSRVLHFKDANAALEYQAQFGKGNTIAGMISHLSGMADKAGIMSVMGPNPEVMIVALGASLAKRIKADPKLSDADRAFHTKALDTHKGALRSSFEIVTGIAGVSENVKWSTIGENTRGVQRMAKLGGAVVTSIPSDTVTVALASQFRGNSFFTGLTRQIGGMLRGKPPHEQAEIGHMLGVGFDSLVGKIMQGASADTPTGAIAKWQERFFRMNGLAGWTDLSRHVAGVQIAAEMGMRSNTGYAALPYAYRHVLGLHGITEAKWDVLRQAALRQSDGHVYMTPDRIRALPLDAFVPLAGARLANPKLTPARRAAILADTRHELELDLHRFVADELNYSVINSDAASQRWTTWGGKRPGTVAGEAARFIMQFKGFPIAFVQRIGARAVYGMEKGHAGRQAFHIGSMVAMLTMAGYMSMTAKDMLKGYWPPRDPGDPRTWIAAMQQGGAWGIYGDFLFSKVNRFGGGFTETIAGPTIGSVGDLVELGLGARDLAIDVATGQEGRFASSQALSWAVGNTPFANLYFVRPALDYMFLNAMRESLSPGYLRKKEKARKTEYGQQSFIPQALGR